MGDHAQRHGGPRAVCRAQPVPAERSVLLQPRRVPVLVPDRLRGRWLHQLQPGPAGCDADGRSCPQSGRCRGSVQSSWEEPGEHPLHGRERNRRTARRRERGMGWPHVSRRSRQLVRWVRYSLGTERHRVGRRNGRTCVPSRWQVQLHDRLSTRRNDAVQLGARRLCERPQLCMWASQPGRYRMYGQTSHKLRRTGHRLGRPVPVRRRLRTEQILCGVFREH